MTVLHHTDKSLEKKGEMGDTESQKYAGNIKIRITNYKNYFQHFIHRGYLRSLRILFLRDFWLLLKLARREVGRCHALIILKFCLVGQKESVS